MKKNCVRSHRQIQSLIFLHHYSKITHSPNQHRKPNCFLSFFLLFFNRKRNVLLNRESLLNITDFFLSGFVLQRFTNHRTAGKGGRHIFNSSLPVPPALQTFSHSPGDYCREITTAQWSLTS